ncbi:hypothetical protein DI396_02620 [Litorivita pollutaquae]|uniref:N-acetyltransferase domain-containing protein n=1 Tax=Litorivita pollutaquae TaxID=2200892 RepID=A0A2V4MTZ2_9RHOB|nr:N-acetyltransferase [Litorivita pollutaquae]OUS20595.1 hypothetical protein A9Q95_09670 [Rhodobacterales bacterium 59_46_T64]PYC48979.1 hypothetical protein DI396_02620 [Litorivita pollutaquae]
MGLHTINRVNLRPVEADDQLAVSILLGTVFDSPDPARMISKLRENQEVALEMLGQQDGKVYGYIAFTRHPRPSGWWGLSLVAVSSAYQSAGLGGRLIRNGLDEARKSGAPAVTVQGDKGYYERFGFSSHAARNLRVSHGADMTMIYPFATGTSGYRGTLTFPAAYTSF